MNREEWLTAMARNIEPHFIRAGFPMGKYRATCGFPSRGARAQRRRTIGQCYSSTCSSDEHSEIFIHPQVADSLRAAGVLVHEMIHAAVGTECGHRGAFVRLANLLGMTGKPTECMPGELLNDTLTEIIALVGAYPHSTLTVTPQTRQTTRMLRVKCGDCGCVVRMTRKWLDESGAPTCGCGGEMWT